MQRQDKKTQSTNSNTRREFVLRAAATTVGVGISPHLFAFLKSTNPNVASTMSGLPHAVNFSTVKITDEFWKSKIAKIATATLPACILQTEVKTARIRNFEKVARKQNEKHEGIYFDDSDVYKAIEAMAYSLSNHPDPKLENKVDEWVQKIAAAQLSDGYLNTYFTLNGLDGRWTDMEKHEDYCAGHLIEAAIAYYRTTGKRNLLDVAIRFADHIDATFRQQNRHWVSGHEEIELALMKLYDVTGNDRYLKLAEWYLDQRGHGYGRGAIWAKGEWGANYCQDGIPVKQQRKITGHAVRAMYLYSGTADVAAITHDPQYLQAMKAVWEDVVGRNMYLTGGIGSSGSNEGFSQDYDLPNAEAYCETCASVGMVFWNHRMNLLTSESKYIDVLERSLYNGALDGLSLSGDHFFYGNPLSSSEAFSGSSLSGHHGRSEWFGTACCPSNIARLVASIGSYIYVVSDRSTWVNLFIGNKTNVRMGQTDVSLTLTTEYPLEGKITLVVDPVRPVRHSLRLRIPGWAKGKAVPGDLYYYADANVRSPQMLVNRKSVQYKEDNGYAVLDRDWNEGDVIELNLPMDVRQVAARQEVLADKERVALERGPLVYCVEGADNSGNAWNFIVPQKTEYFVARHNVLEEPVVAIKCEVPTLVPSPDGLGVQSTVQPMTAVPYYVWANRGNFEMQVWLPTKVENLKING